MIASSSYFPALLVGEREVKKRLGRPRRRWMDIIKMDLVETGWGVENAAIHLGVL
jgi:hypothetical protein